MTITLNDFMAQRKAEIQAEIERLRAELRQIAAAEGMAETETTAHAHRRRELHPTTIKDQVVKILTDCPRGLEASEIQTQLRRRFDRSVKRESLSPQLSRLGAEGVIKREGKVWILPLVETALGRFKRNLDARTNASASRPELFEDLIGELPPKENPQEIHS